MTNPDTSPAVERFDMEWNSPHSAPRMEQEPHGEYVLFTDYQALAAGNDLLITDRDLWKAKAEVQGYIRMKDELEAQPVNRSRNDD